MINVKVNGEPRTLDQPLTVLALLEQLDVDPRIVAVEHNRVVVKRARYGEIVVDEGAEVEIVAFVGGG